MDLQQILDQIKQLDGVTKCMASFIKVYRDGSGQVCIENYWDSEGYKVIFAFDTLEELASRLKEVLDNQQKGAIIE